MSTRDWYLRIEDILEAISMIEEYIAGVDYVQWTNDRKTQDAVIRNIEVIGEAAGHVPTEVQQQFNSIPWQKMKGMRNILIHEYFGVDPDIIWRTCCDDIPLLKQIIYDSGILR